MAIPVLQLLLVLGLSQAEPQPRGVPPGAMVTAWAVTECSSVPVESREPGSGDVEDDPENRDRSEDSGKSERPEVSFPGQYRINAYTVDGDRPEESRQTAARLRIRQSIDLSFDDSFETHLQLQLDHTTGNQATTDESVKVRHAVLAYTAPGPAIWSAGLLPLGDRFGDALFSSEWDYNPLALEARIPLVRGGLRFFAGNLDESSESAPEDDIVHYQAEYEATTGGSGRLVIAATWIEAPDEDDVGRDYYGLGLSGQWALREELELRTFVAASRADGELVDDPETETEGIAAKLELVRSFAGSELSFLATWAEGDASGGGFLPPMSLIGFNGYWGYTGLLTVQGPTDTGFDGDAVNVSNNGYGLASTQMRWRGEANRRLDWYLALGWFGGSRAEGRASNLGIDVVAMGTWHVTDILALDFGVAAARLEDSVSGYFQGAGGQFNAAPGSERDKIALFTRIQAEF